MQGMPKPNDSESSSSNSRQPLNKPQSIRILRSLRRAAGQGALPFHAKLINTGLRKLLGITTFSYRTEPTSRHAEKIIFNARGS